MTTATVLVSAIIEGMSMTTDVVLVPCSLVALYWLGQLFLCDLQRIFALEDESRRRYIARLREVSEKLSSMDGGK